MPAIIPGYLFHHIKKVTQDLQFALKLFDVLPLYGILFDRDGTVITANRAFLDAIGLRQEEIRGMTAEELEIYYIDLRKHLAALATHDSCTFRGRLIGENGSCFPVEHALAHVVDDKREVIASISHRIEGRTLTEERREAEKEIEKANQRKRRFIANINHEIRTPMNAIVGYAEMLAESSLGEQQRRHVEIIKKNSAHLICIVNDIVELSKLETGRIHLLKSTVDLRVLIEHLHELFADQAKGKHLEFTYKIDPALPEHYILDADHCRQILSNLITNAIKYTDAGKITLSVTGNGNRAESYEITFRIIDTGRGMSAQEQESLLELIA
ncbi:MAG: PAS domain S-box protein, partial [Candidatus Electrothrix sp. AUS1_2]|nr:PAS domain S-box protein [Candidatus Electrothrix sp. AUS1_2]